MSGFFFVNTVFALLSLDFETVHHMWKAKNKNSNPALSSVIQIDSSVPML